MSEYVWKRPVIDWDAITQRVRDYRSQNGTPDWDTPLLAEAGEGSLEDLVHFSHPSVVIAKKSSQVGAEIIGALFNNNAGHTKLLVVHNPGEMTGIAAVMDNEVTITTSGQIPKVFGAAQKAAALAIDHCIAAGVLPQDAETRGMLVIGVEAYVDKDAKDLERVQDNFYVALINAIVIAVTGGISPENSKAACEGSHVFADVKSPAAPTSSV